MIAGSLWRKILRTTVGSKRRRVSQQRPKDFQRNRQLFRVVALSPLRAKAISEKSYFPFGLLQLACRGDQHEFWLLNYWAGREKFGKGKGK